MISLSLKKQIRNSEPVIIEFESTRGSSMDKNERLYDVNMEIEPPNSADSMPFFVKILVIDPKEKT